MKFFNFSQQLRSLRRLKAVRQAQSLVDFLRFVVERLLADHCVAIAASLTFTTLLALVPLVMLTLTMVSAFPVFAEYGSNFRNFLFDNLMPDSASRVISEYLRQFTENAGKLTAAGLAMLSVTALSLMYTIENTLNGIWRVKRSRPLARQMLLYWTLLTLGPLLLGVGLSLATSVSWSMSQTFPLLAWLWQLGSVALNWVMLTLLYAMVPHRFVPIRHAMLGALVAALLLMCARMAFALYVDMARSYELIYGAFATVPILLLWLQLLWLIILFGAQLTAALSYWRHGAWQRRFDDRRRLHDAMSALVLLAQAQTVGKRLGMTEFRASLHTGYDEIGQILDCLEAHKFITRTQDERWILLRDAGHIRLLEIYEVFVWQDSGQRSTPVGEVLQGLMRTSQQHDVMSLREFCERVEAVSASLKN